MIPVSLSNSIAPLSFIELLITVVNAIAMLQVILPSTIIVCHSIIIEINALALHDSIIDESVIDLSIGEDVDALAMEDISLP